MAYEYSELQDIKNRVVRDLASNQGKLTTAKGAFAALDSALADMQATYAGWAGEVNAYLTANPADAAALALKAEKDALVSEFSSTRTVVQALDAAINP